MPTRPSRELVTVPNPAPDRVYRVDIETPEFTCLCPITGQPDFATIALSYEPAASLLELKSFKLYLWSYRAEGAFHEAVINRIRDDLVAVLEPRWLRVHGAFNVRGGLATVVTAEHPGPTPRPAPKSP